MKNQIVTILIILVVAIVIIINVIIETEKAKILCIMSLGISDTYCENDPDMPITEDELEKLGEKMAELRIEANEEVDRNGKGEEYGEIEVEKDGETLILNEAEAHIRVLMQVDYYALEGLAITEEVLDDPNSIYKDTNLARLWKVAKGLDEDEDEWLIQDKLMNAQYYVYACYLFGDRSSIWEIDFEPCKELNEAYEREVGEEINYIPVDNQKKIAHKRRTIRETWECIEIEDEELENEEEEEEVSEETPETEEETSEDTENLPVSFKFKNFFLEDVYAHHKDRTFERDPEYECPEGFEREVGADRNLLELEYKQLEPMLLDFQEYSLYKRGKREEGSTVYESDYSYQEFITESLKELYGEAYEGIGLINVPITNSWIPPMESGTYEMSSGYGWRVLTNEDGEEYDDFHDGVDLATERVSDVPIYAMKSGTVVFANPDEDSPVGVAIGNHNEIRGGYGGAVVIKYDDGSSSTYGHMKRSDILVKTGWRVQQGQIVAGVGTEGNSTGEHLHFQICLDYPGSGFGCNTDFVNPMGEEIGLNLEESVIDSVKRSEAVAYFHEVGAELRGLTETEAEKKAKEFLMPGFTPFSGDLFGQLSEKYETGFNGPGTCNWGVYRDNPPFYRDLGGRTSCGTWQIAMGTGTMKWYINWLNNNNYSDYYNVLNANMTGYGQAYYWSYGDRYNTYEYSCNGCREVYGISDPEGFMSTWKAIGEQDGERFKRSQKEFLIQTHYENQLSSYSSATGGFHANNYSRAIKEVVYSITIQHGGGGAKSILKEALGNGKWQNMSEAEIIREIFRVRKIKHSGHSSRYNDEENAALLILENPSLDLSTLP